MRRFGHNSPSYGTSKTHRTLMVNRTKKLATKQARRNGKQGREETCMAEQKYFRLPHSLKQGSVLPRTTKERHITHSQYGGNGHEKKIQNWGTEAYTMRWLAPAREDLLMRIQRNGLPLGFKRQAWGEEYHTKRPFCSQYRIKSYEHLFWDCEHATAIWNNFKTPWGVKVAKSNGTMFYTGSNKHNAKTQQCKQDVNGRKSMRLEVNMAGTEPSDLQPHPSRKERNKTRKPGRA